jgi:hypothetical protein
MEDEWAYLFHSCDPAEAKWACMSKDPKWGVGVFSWHKTVLGALNNAELIGSWVVPAGRGGFIAKAVSERISCYPEDRS